MQAPANRGKSQDGSQSPPDESWPPQGPGAGSGHPTVAGTLAWQRSGRRQARANPCEHRLSPLEPSLPWFPQTWVGRHLPQSRTQQVPAGPQPGLQPTIPLSAPSGSPVPTSASPAPPPFMPWDPACQGLCTGRLLPGPPDGSRVAPAEGADLPADGRATYLFHTRCPRPE